MRNPHGEGGNVYYQQKHHNCGEYERYDGAAYSFQRDTCYSTADEKADSQGRGGETNDEIQDHNGAKVNRVQAELLCQGQENGGKDDERGGVSAICQKKELLHLRCLLFSSFTKTSFPSLEVSERLH